MNLSPGIAVWLVIGAVAGWLAGMIMQGRGFGLVGNIIIGIIGSLVAGYVIPMFTQLGTGIFQDIIDSVIGAIVALIVIGLVKRA